MIGDVVVAEDFSEPIVGNGAPPGMIRNSAGGVDDVNDIPARRRWARRHQLRAVLVN
jgi:hypothetical protein